MRILQANLRTVEIEKHSISCRLRYSLFQDGEIRHPESITCRGDTVVAYFLTSTIRDYIADTAYGFCIERHWKIVPEGSFGLNFCLDFPVDTDVAYLFPGRRAGRPISDEGYLVSGQRTTYANALYLFKVPESVLIFSDPARSRQESGSIELRRLHNDDKIFLHAEVRVPAAPAVHPGQGKKTRKKNTGTQFFRSSGEFEYSLRLNVVSAPQDQIYRRGVSAVLERNASRLHPPPRIPKANTSDFIRDQIHDCLKTFLIDRGPLCGLQETKGKKKLSSLAGCTLAVIQQHHGGEDKDTAELSLRLADFSLKGQHPRGLFYPAYQLDNQSWLAPGPTATISLEESAAIAVALIRFATALQAKGVPASRYLHGATFMADALLGSNQNLKDLGDLLYPDSLLPAGTGPGSLAAIELYLELYRATGKDLYRKTVVALKSKFFTQRVQLVPLLGWDRGSADLNTTLRETRIAISLAEAGHAVKELHRYFDALLPWIHLNRPDSASKFNPMGGVHHTLDDNTLLFRGFEVSYTLLKLNALEKTKSPLGELVLLVSQLLGFALQNPPGTSFYDPEKKDTDRFGPVDSRVWVRELYYLTRLFEEFPYILQE
jgi:hypothetical protein